jgi:hypothetical protein
MEVNLHHQVAALLQRICPFLPACVANAAPTRRSRRSGDPGPPRQNPPGSASSFCAPPRGCRDKSRDGRSCGCRLVIDRGHEFVLTDVDWITKSGTAAFFGERVRLASSNHNRSPESAVAVLRRGGGKSSNRLCRAFLAHWRAPIGRGQPPLVLKLAVSRLGPGGM